MGGEDDEEEVPVKKNDVVVVSRFQMIEYLSAREWWAEGQVGLCFSLAIWLVLLVIVFMRTDVEAAFEVKNALASHMQQVVAHPSISNIAPRPAAETPLPCRCACQASTRGLPEKGSCGGIDSFGVAVEALDFHGIVSSDLVDHLSLEAGGKETAPEMRWDDIMTPEDAWYWVEHGLIPSVWHPRAGYGRESRPGFLLQRNLVIGGIRIRQTRAADAVEGCEVAAGLHSHYSNTCRSPLPAESKYGVYEQTGGNDTSISRAFTPVAEKPGIFDAMLNVERPSSEAYRTVGVLKALKWCDGMTRSLEVKAALLNAEVGLFAYMVVSFDFSPVGEVAKVVSVKTLNVVGAGLSVADYIPELIWIILVIILLQQELRQVCTMCIARQIGEYLADPWNVVDWISILVGVPVAFYWWVISLQTGSLSEDVATLPRTPLEGINLDSFRDTWGGILDDVESVLYVKMYHKFCLFWYASILSLRFLKNFLTQQKLATIQMSMSQAFRDISHFMVIYAALFGNFCLGGRILFGAELEEWSTFSRSAGSSIRMLLGHFTFGEMFEIAPVSATLWFWGFLVCMVFMLSNLLLVIILDHYSTFRKMIGPTPSILHDAKLGFSDFIWRTFDFRWEEFKENGIWDALTKNPYADLSENLMEVAECDEDFIKKAGLSSIGVRLIRREMENLSVEGIADDGNAGGVTLDGLGMRRLGVEPMTANHLLEECEKFVAAEMGEKTSALTQVRQFVVLLKTHKEELDKHCDNLEEGIDDDKEHMWQTMKRLERSIRKSLGTFQLLRTVGVETWAPPLPGALTSSLKDYVPSVASSAIPTDRTTDEERQARLRRGAERQALADGMPWNALSEGSPEVVLSLIARGCDVNAREGDYGETPLHKVITVMSLTGLEGLAKSSQALIDAGADVNLEDEGGNAPLHTALENGGDMEVERIDNLHVLLLANADVNMKGKDGLTPLHLACRACYLEPAKLLVEKGADINFRVESNSKFAGRSALDMAKEFLAMVSDPAAAADDAAQAEEWAQCGIIAKHLIDFLKEKGAQDSPEALADAPAEAPAEALAS
jgi:hypothetical protein